MNCIKVLGKTSQRKPCVNWTREMNWPGGEALKRRELDVLRELSAKAGSAGPCGAIQFHGDSGASEF